jgi:hypothetical protein
MSLLEDGVLPADYQGPATGWPTLEQAYEHFCNNPDDWEKVERGYRWRIFYLLDVMQATRTQMQEYTIRPQYARPIIASCEKEINLLSAAVEKNRSQKREAANRLKSELAEERRRIMTDQRELDKEREALRRETERAKQVYQKFEKKQQEWLNATKAKRKKIEESVKKGEEKTIAELMAEAEVHASNIAQAGKNNR